MAATGVQGRGVLINLRKHFGDGRTLVGYEQLMQVMQADGVVVEGTPAMQCMVWPAGRVESGAQQLKALSASVFSERVQQWHAQQPSAANGIDVLDSLRQLVRLQAELRQFVDAAATRRDAMLLYAV